jgi:flagellar hook-length control protein FliK
VEPASAGAPGGALEAADPRSPSEDRGAGDADGFKRALHEKSAGADPLQAGQAGGDEESSGVPRFELPVREARGQAAPDSALPRTDGPQAAGRQGTAETLRTGVFEQIVQRAAVQVKNHAGEVSIELKPEFLGQVRMQITSENHQVTVRITTEHAAVRDMIESGLQQLKADLQQQGLQVERMEVAVSTDSRRQPGRQAPAYRQRRHGSSPAVEAVSEAHPASAVEAARGARYPAGGRGVDMFV